jgi:hypothetical protein
VGIETGETDMDYLIKVRSDGAIFINGSLSDLRVRLNDKNGVRTLVRMEDGKAVKLDDVTGVWHNNSELDHVIRGHLATA